MNNQRLSNEMREAIVVKALHHAFEKDRAAIEVAKTALADAIYEHAYGAQEVLALQLGEPWVECDEVMRISCKDWTDDELHLSKSRPQPNATGYYRPDCYRIEEENPMYKKVSALARKIDKLNEREEELRRKLMGLLRSVNTVKRLLEEWPEGATFIPAYTPPYSVVPATLTHEINRMLGLEPSPKADPAKAAITKAAS